MNVNRRVLSGVKAINASFTARRRQKERIKEGVQEEA